MITAKRGRPKTGRKEVLQVPLEKADIAAVKAIAESEGRPVADVMRDAVAAYLKARKS